MPTCQTESRGASPQGVTCDGRVRLIVSCMCILMTLAGCMQRSTSARAGLSLRIVSITPCVRSIDIDGSMIYTTADDHALLSNVHGVHPRGRSCTYHIEIMNNTERSYLLSESDLYYALINCTLRDTDGVMWSPRLTIRGHPDDVSYNMPLMAGRTRSWLFVLGMTELTRQDDQPFDTIPSHYDYQIRTGVVISARILADNTIGVNTTVPLEGAGRCLVSHHGPTLVR